MNIHGIQICQCSSAVGHSDNCLRKSWSAALKFKKQLKKKPIVEIEFWARAILYEPFTMGGPVNRQVKYKLMGLPQKIGKYDTFINKRSKNRYMVYEKITGGFVGEGLTMLKAIQKVKHNIKITPDLDDQMKQTGKIENCPERETKEVLRRLERTQSKKKR